MNGLRMLPRRRRQPRPSARMLLPDIMLIIGSRVRKRAERLTNTDRLGAALAWCRAHARAEAPRVEWPRLRVVGGRGRPQIRLRGRGRIPSENRAVILGVADAVSQGGGADELLSVMFQVPQAGSGVHPSAVRVVRLAARTAP